MLLPVQLVFDSIRFDSIFELFAGRAFLAFTYTWDFNLVASTRLDSADGCWLSESLISVCSTFILARADILIRAYALACALHISYEIVEIKAQTPQKTEFFPGGGQVNFNLISDN